MTAAFIVLPGAALFLALIRPGRLSLPAQIAAILGLGYATTTLLATVLVVGRVFVPWLFIALVGTLTAAMLILATLRGTMMEHVRAWRTEATEDRWLLAAGAVAIGVMLIVVFRTTSPLLNFGVANPLRYWADGLEIADLGRVPAVTLQWGSLWEPAVSKLGFSAFSGAMSFISSEPLGPPRLLVPLASTGVALGGWALGRELGLRFTAPLLTLLAGLAATDSLVTAPFREYRAEGFARWAVVVGLALAVNALRTKDLAIAGAAGACFGAAAITHLVPVMVAAILFAGYAAGKLLAERDLRSLLAPMAVVGGVSAACLGLTLGASGGAVAFESVSDETEIDTKAGTFDPTRYLANGTARTPENQQPAVLLERNDGWFQRPGAVTDRYVSNSTSGEAEGWAPRLIFVGLALAGLALSLFGAKELRPVAFGATSVWVGLLVIGFYFAARYETYVPALMPQRRLFAYGSLPLVLLGLVVVELVLRRIARDRDRAVRVGAAAIILLAAVPTLDAGSYPSDIDRAQDSARAIAWINENLPCDARLLVSQRTAGTFQALSGRVAVTEGMAPYLRPGMLNEIVAFLLDAREFLEDPASHRSVLDEHHVDHLVFVKEEHLFNRRPPLLGDPSVEPLRDAPFLETVRDDDTMAVFRVRDPVPGDVPDPAEHAGYSCRRA